MAVVGQLGGGVGVGAEDDASGEVAEPWNAGPAPTRRNPAVLLISFSSDEKSLFQGYFVDYIAPIHSALCDLHLVNVEQCNTHLSPARKDLESLEG